MLAEIEHRCQSHVFTLYYILLAAGENKTLFVLVNCSQDVDDIQWNIKHYTIK